MSETSLNSSEKPHAANSSPLRSSFADDPDMAELVEYFVEEVPARLQSLRDLCESGDREGVQRIAHQLKGACAGYGFETVGLAAAKVEQPLKEDASLDDVREQIDELTDLLRRVVN
jgi:HPt (histidine-containing phosphotransfer) domain-containing protein